MTRTLLCSATALSLSLAALVAGPAIAQESQGDDQQTENAQQSEGDATWVDIATWDLASVYEGWSAKSFLGETVVNQDGDDIGEVEDFIIGPDGKLQRVVVEGGGFLDIGDAHLAIPWEEVTFDQGAPVTVPISGEDLDNVTGYPNMDDMPALGENFRVREVIGDYLATDGVGYGTVDDVIFGDDGMIQALVVFPSPGFGYRTTPVALPYYADTYDPYTAYFEVPYGVAQLDELRPFDYSEFE